MSINTSAVDIYTWYGSAEQDRTLRIFYISVYSLLIMLWSDFQPGTCINAETAMHLPRVCINKDHYYTGRRDMGSSLLHSAKQLPNIPRRRCFWGCAFWRTTHSSFGNCTLSTHSRSVAALLPVAYPVFCAVLEPEAAVILLYFSTADYYKGVGVWPVSGVCAQAVS